MKRPNVYSKKFAEFVGVLLGDGSIGEYIWRRNNITKTQHRIKISTNSVADREYIKYLEKLIKDLFDIKPHVKKRKNELTCDLLIFNKELFKFLTKNVKLIKAPKKNRAAIPSQYMNTERELDVLRGYFDTDGCVVITNNNGTTYPRLEFKVSASPMRNQFIEILSRRGYRVVLSNSKDNVTRIQLNGKAQLKKWVNEIGFSNKKHMRKTAKVIYREKTCF